MTSYSDTAATASSGLGAPTPSISGRRTPAPGTLEFVRTFLNSANIEAGTDELGTPESAALWLQSRTADVRPPGEATRDGTQVLADVDLARLVAFREALRDLLAARADGATDDAARAVLQREALANPLALSIEPDGGAAIRPAGGGVDGAIARVLGAIAEASLAGTWGRFKVCRNDACRWAFYDASRNHSGTWCTMAVCGNRFKGRAFRRRREGRRA
jgi:predicted RNA-binding Zn ribbon-like protein